MSDAPHALIAGAGIGGLTAALYLARAGFRVSLLERAKLLEEVGAGLQISPNASALLRDLGILPRLAGTALAPAAIRVRRGHDGAFLQLLPLADAEARWGAPYLLVHRADLQRALLDAVAQMPAITLAMQTELTGFATTETGLEATAQQQGTRQIAFSADCLIGADGLRSCVRQHLADLGCAGARTQISAMPIQAKHVAWRTLVDAGQVAPAFRKAETTLWLGAKAHLVHYPLRGGTVINVVAIVDAATEIDQSADLWSQAGEPSEIVARFSTWHKEVRALIAAGREWRKWPLVDLDPLPTWTMGRIALLGDAAHPMLPFLAQGAAQAIEDAAMLGAAVLDNPGRIDSALAAYAAARRPRASRVQHESRRQARLYHLSGTAGFFRDLGLRNIGGRHWLARYDWLYGRGRLDGGGK